VKKNEGPFGKRGVEENRFSVGSAPGISADGEAIVDYDDDGVELTKQRKRSSRKDRAITFRGVRNRTIIVAAHKFTPTAPAEPRHSISVPLLSISHLQLTSSSAHPHMRKHFVVT